MIMYGLELKSLYEVFVLILWSQNICKYKLNILFKGNNFGPFYEKGPYSLLSNSLQKKNKLNSDSPIQKFDILLICSLPCLVSSIHPAIEMSKCILKFLLQ